jgi:hypothetical protein
VCTHTNTQTQWRYGVLSEKKNVFCDGVKPSNFLVNLMKWKTVHVSHHLCQISDGSRTLKSWNLNNSALTQMPVFFCLNETKTPDFRTCKIQLIIRIREYDMLLLRYLPNSHSPSLLKNLLSLSPPLQILKIYFMEVVHKQGSLGTMRPKISTLSSES